MTPLQKDPKQLGSIKKIMVYKSDLKNFALFAIFVGELLFGKRFFGELFFGEFFSENFSSDNFSSENSSSVAIWLKGFFWLKQGSSELKHRVNFVFDRERYQV